MTEPIDNSTDDIVLYSYNTDSDSYVSSTTRYTPFPSLTNMEKQKILDICHAQPQAQLECAKHPIEEPINEEANEPIDYKHVGCCLIL